jgi:hypothetical protein
MENAREEKLDISFDMDDDGPDARQRRRERREALKLALKRVAEVQNREEDDEALLDESDTDDQERPMVQGEQTTPTADPDPAGSEPMQDTGMGTTGDDTDTAAAAAAAAAVTIAAAAAAAAADIAAAAAAASDTAGSSQDTGTVNNSGNKKPDQDESQNKF